MDCLNKLCIRCGEVKAVDCFHRHKMMADGRLNKCAACVVIDVRLWRVRQPDGERVRRYARELELGSRTRVAPQKYGRDPTAHPRAAAKYSKKRKRQTVLSGEFNTFVFEECLLLNELRKKATGFAWSLDHTIPLNHRLVSGLHVAENFQSVPLSWNLAKKNMSMERFFGGMGY